MAIKMESLVQGRVIGLQGREYRVQLSSQEERVLRGTPQTVHNGWPTLGDHVVIMVNEEQEALVMTRFMYTEVRAA